MRSLFLLLAFQFLLSAVVVAGTPETSQPGHVLHPEAHKNVSIAIFFEEAKSETEKEADEFKLSHHFEIADLSHVSLILVRAHDPGAPSLPFEQRYGLRPPLFMLFRVFLI